MFGKKKKKTPKKLEKQDKKELAQLSDRNILIRVYKNFGSNTSFLKAEYLAEERRDIYNNLVSINEEYLHNEDTDFAIEDVYREMEIILEFSKKSRSERLEILDKKIRHQDKLLQYLKKYIQLNSMFNYADEELKGRDLKILRNYISKHDGNGAYFTIEKGKRVYSFEAVDGFLVPIWYGVDTYSKYPDHTRKVKINIQEEQRMRQEMALYNKEKKLGQILTVATIFVAILFVSLLFTGYKVWVKNNDLEEKINGNAYKCAEYTSKVNQQFTQIMENTVVKKLLDEQKQEQETAKQITPENQDLSPDNLVKKFQ